MGQPRELRNASAAFSLSKFLYLQIFCRYLQLGKWEQKSSQVEFIYKKRALSSTLLCMKNSFFG